MSRIWVKHILWKASWRVLRMPSFLCLRFFVNLSEITVRTVFNNISFSSSKKIWVSAFRISPYRIIQSLFMHLASTIPLFSKKPCRTSLKTILYFPIATSRIQLDRTVLSFHSEPGSRLWSSAFIDLSNSRLVAVRFPGIRFISSALLFRWLLPNRPGFLPHWPVQSFMSFLCFTHLASS